MKKLKYYQDIIKEKRKKTTFRNYLKEIASLRTINLYNNSGFVSVYSPDIDRIGGVISHKQFNENKDLTLEQGGKIEISNNFFESFNKLYKSVDLAPTFIHGECEHAHFSDQTVSSNNIYLSFVIIRGCENILYSFSVKENSINVFNSILVWDTCENIYSSKGIIKSFNIFYSKHIINSSNIWFSSNLIGCHDCLFCSNLENSSYYINNKQYTKQEYKLEKEKILKNKNQFHKWQDEVDDNGTNYSSNEVNGIFNIQSENIENGANNYQIKNARNIMFVGGKDVGENIFDCFLNTPPETDVYGVFSTGYGDNIYNSYHVNAGTNIYYCIDMENCSYCLGCVGLKNRTYCIFNKQYSKDNWETQVLKIFSDMEKQEILGEFFPGSFNPFYFNDSAAFLIDDSFTKEEVEADGFLWRDDEIKVDIPEGAEVIKATDLNNYQGFNENNQWKINPDIMNKVIVDEKGNHYKIVKMEYDFLMKYSLPLPDIHWLDRIKKGFKFK